MESSDKERPARPRVKGIYLLPNLFTVGALFSGFYAIIVAAQGLFAVASMAIFIAMLLDTLDGRIARLTHSQSEFGTQLDSLSDIVCFGLSPAVVLYMWSLSVLGKPGWLVAFFYMVCAALRLARFNSQSQQENKRYFQGLATTSAAGVVAGTIWVCTEWKIAGQDHAVAVMVLVILLGLMQVSAIRYRSFKDIDMRGKVPFVMMLTLVSILVLISFNPPLVLLSVFTVYLLSGPACTIWGLRHRQKARHELARQRSMQQRSHDHEPH